MAQRRPGELALTASASGGNSTARACQAGLLCCARQVLDIRCRAEGLSLSKEAAEVLAAVGVRTSLRYAVHLLTPAAILAQADITDEDCDNAELCEPVIHLRHVQEVDALFQDAKTSSKRLAREADFFIQ